ncbi:MAG: T9SS type A sorting domain-containing protein [Flavobacteriales bacterium]|nr:T9SS type A sorting domain-containing protein [Flavobacteriales bacterium]
MSFDISLPLFEILKLNMKKLLTNLLLMLPVAGLFAQTTIVDSIIHDNIERNYRLYVPASYNGSVAVPLVFNLHGYTSNAMQQELYGDFRAIADTANFLVVHPNGTLDGTGTTFWNAFDVPTETVDDVGFLSALIDSLNAEYNIDLNRVYTTGMSNGGFMSYKLACDLSYRIAAMASVTGSMVTTQIASCSPTHPMPVMEIHGTADPTVPYTGSGTLGSQPIVDVVDYWVNFNNCNSTAVQTAVPNTSTTDGCTTDHFLYTGGDNGATVEHYRVNGGGHTWPGAPIDIGVTSHDFSASVEIWRFFSQYTLDQLVSVEEATNVEQPFSVYPNPSEGQFSLRFKNTVSAKIRVFDAVGKLVLNETSRSKTVRLELPSSGIYFLQVETGHGIFTEKLIRN